MLFEQIATGGCRSYLVGCADTGAAVLIDPEISQVDHYLALAARNGLRLHFLVDTHTHADHFSAARYLKSRTGAPTAIGERIVGVQKLWRAFYNWPDFPADGSQWDRLLADGEQFRLGEIEARVMLSPGHTLASITYVFGDAAFIHDTLFMPDGGTARADFPGGDAGALWRSIQAILSLPEETRLFVGHDYQPGGRAVAWQTSIRAQMEGNRHIIGHDEASFVAMRGQRDATLAIPRLMLHALQVNLNGGRLPDLEENGRRYLKLPLEALGSRAWS